jgi:hypothetical protein
MGRYSLFLAIRNQGLRIAGGYRLQEKISMTSPNSYGVVTQIRQQGAFFDTQRMGCTKPMPIALIACCGI